MDETVETVLMKSKPTITKPHIVFERGTFMKNGATISQAEVWDHWDDKSATWSTEAYEKLAQQIAKDWTNEPSRISQRAKLRAYRRFQKL